MSMSPCPRCKFAKTAPVTDDGARLYCPNCQFAWVRGQVQTSLANKGTLEFKGISLAKTFIDSIGKDLSLSAELKSVIVAQLTGAYYEQWFEGFKAGLLADILKHKELTHVDGKTGGHEGPSDREHSGRTSETAEAEGENGLARRSDRQTSGGARKVKEFVCGVEVYVDIDHRPTEATYVKVAEWVEALGGRDKIRCINLPAFTIEMKHEG